MARRTRWVDNLVGTTVSNGGQANDNLFQGTGSVDTQGWTVTRLIGEIALSSATTAGAWGLQLIDIGIGMISSEAISAGAFPDPNIESDKPGRGWMWRAQKTVFQNGVGTSIVVPVTIDIRSQRKVEDGTLHIIFNSTNLRGTSFTCDLNGLIRVLVLLP